MPFNASGWLAHPEPGPRSLRQQSEPFGTFLEWNLVCNVSLQETDRMQRSNQCLRPSDSQIPVPIFKLDKVIRSDTRAIDHAIREITAVLKRLYSCDDIDLVVLAIQEALNNALFHGNRCDSGKTIAISVSVGDHGALFVSIKDSGSGFDPRAVPNPLAGKHLLSDHGGGLFFMRQFMDEVEFNFDHGTEVRMRRRRKETLG